MRVHSLSAIGLIGLLTLCVFFPAQRCAASWFSPPKALLRTSFEQDPLQSGWHADGADGKAGAPSWVSTRAHSGTHCIALSIGYWHSPAFPVTPQGYYSVTMYTEAETNQGFWNVTYYDAKGAQVVADNYSSVDKSSTWLKSTTCVRAPQGAATGVLSYRVDEGCGTVWIDDVTVKSVSRKDVAKWSDATIATLPPIHYTPPANRCQLLPRTMAALKNGGNLRIVMLGDSIVNDTSNSDYEVLLERAYPKAHIEVITSVRGATGCSYYRNDNHVQSYVLDYKPDLLLIGGISQDNAEDVREVIKQVRAVSTPEIAVMTGTESYRTVYDEKTKQVLDLTLDPQGKDFRSQLCKMAGEEKVEFIDMGKPFADYTLNCGKPFTWFQRDAVHGNVRAKQVVGRILAAYLSPDQK